MAAILLTGVLAAAPAAAREPAPAAVVDFSSWLERLRQASTQRNYEGTVVHQAAGQLSSARVSHFNNGSEHVERLDALDGRARQVYRRNESVQTLWPDARVAIIEQRDAGDQASVLWRAAPSARAQMNYEMQVLGQGRVAGHDAVIVMLTPRDALRFAQRLWTERSSGLLLRTEVLASDGGVLESATFTDLQLDIRAPAQAMVAPDNYRIVKPQQAPTTLEAQGWVLAEVAGFVPVRCVKRVAHPDARGAKQEMVQAVFSDGLTQVSVFIEAFSAQVHRPLAGGMGATQTLSQRRGPWWITILGDVPAPTLGQFSAALERRR